MNTTRPHRGQRCAGWLVGWLVGEMRRRKSKQPEPPLAAGRGSIPCRKANTNQSSSRSSQAPELPESAPRALLHARLALVQQHLEECHSTTVAVRHRTLFLTTAGLIGQRPMETPRLARTSGSFVCRKQTVQDTHLWLQFATPALGTALTTWHDIRPANVPLLAPTSS